MGDVKYLELTRGKQSDTAALKYHGEFARLNFPKED